MIATGRQVLQIGGKCLSLNGTDRLSIDPAFVIQIDTTKGNGFTTFELPLTNHLTDVYVEVVGRNDLRRHITTWNSGDRLIEFGAAGVYTIKLYGQGGWSFNNAGDRLKLIRVDRLGSFRFNYAEGAFFGCSNMVYFDEQAVINAPNVTSLFAFLASCNNLASKIPPKLLYNCTNVTNLRSVFYNCSGLSGSIPSDLLLHVPLVTNLQWFFNGCSGLSGSIPSDLLRYVPLVTNLQGFFRGCSGLVIDAPFIDEALIPNVLNWVQFMFTSSTAGSITGTVQPIWLTANPAAPKTDAFLNQIQLTNYADIPNDWKGL
jgi:hypothetical protein